MPPLTILPDDEVYRRLHVDTVDFAKGEVRRNAFYTRGEPDRNVSVQVKRVAGSPEEALARADRLDYGMGLLKVSDIRSLGFDVSPNATEDDPAHAILTGISTKVDCDKLAGKTKIVKLPKR